MVEVSMKCRCVLIELSVRRVAGSSISLNTALTCFGSGNEVKMVSYNSVSRSAAIVLVIKQGVESCKHQRIGYNICVIRRRATKVNPNLDQ